MTRQCTGESKWAMVCDAKGCTNQSDVRRTQNDLPSDEFVRAGWFIAVVHGDRCPPCAVDYQPPTKGPGRRSRVMDAVTLPLREDPADMAEGRQP